MHVATVLSVLKYPAHTNAVVPRDSILATVTETASVSLAICAYAIMGQPGF